MKKLTTLIAVIALCALSILANAASREAGTVDMTFKLTVKGSSQSINAKVFFAKNKSRVESSGMPGMAQQKGKAPEKYIVIVDGVKMVAYAIVPGMGYAMRYNLSSMAFGNGNPAGNPTEVLDAKRYPPGAKIRQAGTKTYKGKTVTVYKVDYTVAGAATSSTIYTDANKLPVYIAGKSGATQYELTFANYRFGKQKPSLFELPKDLPVMDMSQYEGAMAQK
jgi:hypothetical protein